VIANLSVGRFGGADARRTLMAGAIICAFGYALTYAAAAFIPARVPGFLVPGIVLLGLGHGLFMTPVVNAVLSEIPERHTGAASGVLNTMQRVGNALGVAVLEIPFFATFDQARSAGATMVQSYTSAFSLPGDQAVSAPMRWQQGWRWLGPISAADLRCSGARSTKSLPNILRNPTGDLATQLSRWLLCNGEQTGD
jgi:MFS family permease